MSSFVIYYSIQFICFKRRTIFIFLSTFLNNLDILAVSLPIYVSDVHLFDFLFLYFAVLWISVVLLYVNLLSKTAEIHSIAKYRNRIRKHEAKQQKFTASQNIETEKSNKWMSFTYTGNKTARISKLLKKMDKSKNIYFKQVNWIL